MTNKIETFPDGSTIETDEATGNRTVVGKLAHDEYMRRLRQEETNQIRERKPATHNFLLKDQLQILLAGWNVTEPLPGKNKKLVVAFAGKPLSRVEIRQSVHKSTYGKPMYLIEHYAS